MIPLVIGLAAGPTFAEDGPSDAIEEPTRKGHQGRPYHLDLEAHTSVPLDAGVRLGAEFPHRLRLTTSIGGVPGGYVDLINGIVVAAGGYDGATAVVIRHSLTSSVVWRTRLGWRPLEKYGFYVEAGYGMVKLGGDLSAAEVLQVVREDEAAAAVGDDSYGIDATLHLIDVELGYQFLVYRDNLSIRPAIGYAGALGSNTNVSVTHASDPALAGIREQAAGELATYLDKQIFGKHMHTAMITLAFGYRFF
jgi:hypothetical protein